MVRRDESSRWLEPPAARPVAPRLGARRMRACVRACPPYSCYARGHRRSPTQPPQSNSQSSISVFSRGARVSTSPPQIRSNHATTKHGPRSDAGVPQPSLVSGTLLGKTHRPDTPELLSSLAGAQRTKVTERRARTLPPPSWKPHLRLRRAHACRAYSQVMEQPLLRVASTKAPAAVTSLEANSRAREPGRISGARETSGEDTGALAG